MTNLAVYALAYRAISYDKTLALCAFAYTERVIMTKFDLCTFAYRGRSHDKRPALCPSAC